MADWRGVEFVEFVGNSGLGQSPQEQFGVDRASAAKIIDIEWEDVSRAVRLWLGYGEVKTNPVGGAKYLSRTTPHYHADRLRQTDSKPYLFATGIASQGYAPDRSLPADESRMKSPRDTTRYAKARLKIQYETLPYEVLTDEEMILAGYATDGQPDESYLKRYVSIFPRPKGKFLGLVGTTFKFASATPPGPSIPQPPGRIVPSWDIRITWHQVPADAVPSITVNPVLQASSTLGAIDTTVGKVNRSEFLGLPAGSLLCLPPELTPRRGPRGDRIYDVQFYFEFFPYLHNRVPRLTGGVFGFVRCSADGADWGDVSATSGKLIYDSIAFEDMFRPPA